VPPQRDDLFKIFPDLPRFERPSREARLKALSDSVERWRERARKNIARQKASAAAMKQRVADRKTRRG
jgi:hypothetical protein